VQKRDRGLLKRIFLHLSSRTVNNYYKLHSGQLECKPRSKPVPHEYVESSSFGRAFLERMITRDISEILWTSFIIVFTRVTTKPYVQPDDSSPHPHTTDMTRLRQYLRSGRPGAGRDSLSTWSNIYVHKKESGLNPNSNTMEPGR
jgi:hypothetical protein